MEATLRSTVGRDAEVPSRRTASDMAGIYSPAARHLPAQRARDARHWIAFTMRAHESLARTNTWVRSLHIESHWSWPTSGPQRRERSTRKLGERGTGQSGPPYKE